MGSRPGARAVGAGRLAGGARTGCEAAGGLRVLEGASAGGEGGWRWTAAGCSGEAAGRGAFPAARKKGAVGLVGCMG
jgi:hypothetical protein